MKAIIKYLNLTCCIGLSAAVTAFAEPTPSPSPTPHSEPSASPTPHSEPSPSPTPRSEPSASPTPTGTPKEPTPTPSATATPGDHGEVSLRGVYGATTPSGGLIVFCIDKNTFVQVNMLDIAGQVIGFAEGPLYRGLFSLKLTTGQAVVGTANENGIAFTLAGQPFQASRFSTFGTDSAIAGRYFGVAHGPNGESQVMFIIDSNQHIILVQRTGSLLTGGFGTVTAPTSQSGLYTFTLNAFIGSTSAITGSFTITEGVFSGMFQTSAGTFTV